MRQEEDDCFSEVLPALHLGAVAGVDGAVRRPLVATAGADRAVRLWNHATRCVDVQFRSHRHGLVGTGCGGGCSLLFIQTCASRHGS